MTCRSESSACFRRSSAPAPPRARPIPTPVAAAAAEARRSPARWRERSWLELIPWSVCPCTTATVAAIQTRFRSTQRASVGYSEVKTTQHANCVSAGQLGPQQLKYITVLSDSSPAKCF
ncbi:hypothetical protein C4D60_Mb09t11250 [Musa balbisiana]|uniref:Uncharacterized protein n=1 Tax=Musa balbisiana TaxID=52838 RepID=A0A4S8IFM6_MUSBA|nr:hypothetical protein C4D60_Mb09t11250 [Musa balbisiana]